MPSTAEENILFAGRFSPFTLPQPSRSVNRLLFLSFDAEEMTDNAFAKQHTEATALYLYQAIASNKLWVE